MRRILSDRHAGLVVAAMAMVTFGCGDERMSGPTSIASRNFEVDASRSMPGEVAALAPMIPAVQGDAAGEVIKTSATAGRKIIYNALIDLVTEDLNALESKLTPLILASKGYVADSERSGSAGSSLHGMWKVRIPVESYEAFVKGVTGLGELVRLKADSQDVSEEFFDLEARQSAKKVEEERLLKHLKDSTGKLEDILAVERELSRVRTEIERMQGRLRLLANLTSLTTVTISASEIKGYVPPQAPTLGTRVARTFGASLDSLREFGEGLLIVCVALVPWLPLIALGVGIVYWLARRSIARARTITLIEVPPAPRG